MPRSLKNSAAEQGLMPNTSPSCASCTGPRETWKVLVKQRGQNGERYPMKENKPAPFHLFPFLVPFRPPVLLSLGAFNREHHTIHSKPEIRTVNEKMPSSCSTHARDGAVIPQAEEGVSVSLCLYMESGVHDTLLIPLPQPTLCLCPPQPISCFWCNQSHTLFLKSYPLLAYAALLSHLQLVLCMIFPSSSTPSPSPWASQETYSFFFFFPPYFQPQPLFFVHDPQLCLHSRLTFPSTLDLGMSSQSSCCTSCKSDETSTWLKAQVLILFGLNEDIFLSQNLLWGFTERKHPSFCTMSVWLCTL